MSGGIKSDRRRAQEGEATGSGREAPGEGSLLSPLSPADFRDVPRSEAVYQALRQALQEGKLAPGERVREAELAERLGVSRTPVREAMRRLTTEGFMVVSGGRGLTVAEHDKQQVLELYALREVLEGAAAGFAAHRADEGDIETLWTIVAEETRHAGNPERLAALNREFHRALYTAAHNRYLMSVVNGLADAMHLLRGTTLAEPGRAQTSHEQHVAMVSAIEQRDAEEAERLARNHIREARRLRMQMISRARLQTR